MRLWLFFRMYLQLIAHPMSDGGGAERTAYARASDHPVADGILPSQRVLPVGFCA
jgi:hypothetical protein